MALGSFHSSQHLTESCISNLKVQILAISYYLNRMVYLPQALTNFLSNKTVHSFTSFVGTAFIIYSIYRILHFAWIFFRPSRLQRFRHAASGSWALVTGSSDGIGRAFAEDLVKRGFRVLLHGRNEEKLIRVKNEILQTYPGGYIDFVVADASKPGDSYNLIVQKVKSLPGKLTVRMALKSATFLAFC